MAERLNVRQQVYARWETGERRMPPPRLYKLLGLLKREGVLRDYVEVALAAWGVPDDMTSLAAESRGVKVSPFDHTGQEATSLTRASEDEVAYRSEASRQPPSAATVATFVPPWMPDEPPAPPRLPKLGSRARTLIRTWEGAF